MKLKLELEFSTGEDSANFHRDPDNHLEVILFYVSNHRCENFGLGGSSSVADCLVALKFAGCS